MSKKILIVDDQFGIRLLLQEVFKREGFITFTAENGKKAISIVEKNKPDIVLLDIKIPGMDGIEILRRLKKIDEHIKVIIMTAYGELDMLEEAKSLGALSSFSKPFDIEVLTNEVKKHLMANRKNSQIISKNNTLNCIRCH